MTHSIYFDQPSNKYEEALPVGTGKLGAMVGGAIKERFIWVNEETVWYGGPRDRINPDASTHIGKIKELVKDGKMQEAERLAILTLSGMPESQRHYTTLGLISLNFNDHDNETENFMHRLDFKTATTTTEYSIKGARHKMTVHANQPESVLIIRLSSSAPVLGFYAGIERGERVGQFSYGTHQDEMIRHTDNGVIMTGSCGGKNGLEFASALFAESNGKTEILGDKIVVSEASEAILYFSAATNYQIEDPIDHVICQSTLARNKGYDLCYENHLAEWVPQYSQAQLGLGENKNFVDLSMNRLVQNFSQIKGYNLGNTSINKAESSPTVITKGNPNAIKERVSNIMSDEAGGNFSDNKSDNLPATNLSDSYFDYLINLLFHFGRYVLLSCSRDCELPASLQGIWCRDLLPIWDGKFTTNINLQMAYWAADSANMSACYAPYIRLAERVRETGTETASRMYNCRGFVLHNNTDIWADTAVQDAGSHCSYWFLGGVWIAVDLYEHFRYTQDLSYLQRIWPIMRDASLFIIDFLDEKDDGSLVMGVTTSPENSYYDKNSDSVSFCQMTAMDSQLITILMNQCIDASKLLNEAYGFFDADEAYLKEVKNVLSNIEQTQIGEDGTILEWSVEVKEAEPAHRHSSHLIGAYPYSNITEKETDLFNAVSKSVDKRLKNGGYNNGWGYAWGAGLLARLKRGQAAKGLLIDLFNNSCQPNLFSCCNIRSVPKLMENNMPMQVDGTLGLIQSVTEMLLQSHIDGEIRLLPALADSWQDGRFSGFVARGNVIVDATWCGGKIVTAILCPQADLEANIICPNDFYLQALSETIYSEQHQARIRMKAGEKYTIHKV